MGYVAQILMAYCIIVAPPAAPAATPGALRTSAQPLALERSGVKISYDRGTTWLAVASVAYPPPRDPNQGPLSGRRRHLPFIVIEGGLVSPDSVAATIPQTGQVFKTLVVRFRNRRITLTNATVDSVTPVGTHSTTKIDWQTAPQQPKKQSIGNANEYIRVSFIYSKIEYTDDYGKTMYGDNWYH